MLELPDDLLDHLATVRGHFVHCYRDAIEKALDRTGRVEGRVGVEATVSVEGQDETLMLDLFEVLDDGTYQPIHVIHRSFLPSPDVTHPLDGAELTVGELVWFATQLTVAPAIDPAAIHAWFTRWHNTGFEVERPFRGLVHFVDIEETDDGIAIAVDFGSAPVEAVRDLIERCVTAGACRLDLRSHPNHLAGIHPA